MLPAPKRSASTTTLKSRRATSSTARTPRRPRLKPPSKSSIVPIRRRAKRIPKDLKSFIDDANAKLDDIEDELAKKEGKKRSHGRFASPAQAPVHKPMFGATGAVAPSYVAPAAGAVESAPVTPAVTAAPATATVIPAQSAAPAPARVSRKTFPVSAMLPGLLIWAISTSSCRTPFGRRDNAMLQEPWCCILAWPLIRVLEYALLRLRLNCTAPGVLFVGVWLGCILLR